MSSSIYGLRRTHVYKRCGRWHTTRLGLFNIELCQCFLCDISHYLVQHQVVSRLHGQRNCGSGTPLHFARWETPRHQAHSVHVASYVADRDCRSWRARIFGVYFFLPRSSFFPYFPLVPNPSLLWETISGLYPNGRLSLPFPFPFPFPGSHALWISTLTNFPQSPSFPDAPYNDVPPSPLDPPIPCSSLRPQSGLPSAAFRQFVSFLI